MSIEEVKKEQKELLEKLSDPEFLCKRDEFLEASKRLSFLNEYISLISKKDDIWDKKNQAEEILKIETDEDMISLAKSDILILDQEEESLKFKIKSWEDENAGIKSVKIKGIVMEIRAGAGGDEAALFAHDLFLMYTRFSQKMSWSWQIIDSNMTDLEGIKEISFEIKNKATYESLRYEAGVHRVQRVPTTEKSGRVHTSTATVAVLPQPQEVSIQVKNEDLEESFFRSSGAGGQNVQKVESAVRIVHKPTGLTVTCQSERAQHQNRMKALEILKAKLFQLEEEKVVGDLSTKRREQIGHGDRSEKIRTYNIPQDRVTDHRLKKSYHHLESILNGELDPIISDLRQTGGNWDLSDSDED